MCAPSQVGGWLCPSRGLAVATLTWLTVAWCTCPWDPCYLQTQDFPFTGTFHAPEQRVSQRLSCLELRGSGTFVRALRCPCGRGEFFCRVSQGGSGVSCLGMSMTEAASGAAVCGQTCPLSPEQADGSTAAGRLVLRPESLLATF